MKDKQTIEMPAGAQILTVQNQDNIGVLWAIVPDGVPKMIERRVIATYGTGHEMTDAPHTYIGTYQLAFGRLIYHIFETI